MKNVRNFKVVGTLVGHDGSTFVDRLLPDSMREYAAAVDAEILGTLEAKHPIVARLIRRFPCRWLCRLFGVKVSYPYSGEIEVYALGKLVSRFKVQHSFSVTD